MPANKKYLSSPGQRLLKVTAAIVGGYLVTNALLLLLLHFFSKREVLISMKFMSYLIWITLMVIAFLAKNGWKIWGWYLLACLVLLSPVIYTNLFR